MITRPLELESRLSPPPRDLDFFAWVNVAVITLFFSLLGSRFVLAPGVAIGVGDGGVLAPPTVGPSSVESSRASVVVSVRRDNVVLFEGGVYSLPDLRKQMTDYTKNHSGAVLLVRADRQVSVQALLDLCDMAKSVGFANVFLAGESPVAEGSPLIK
jgi:biopolymer transport protein ExbD